jgi:hypothetical protein
VAYHLFYGLHIDTESLKKVQKLAENKSNRIVFMPVFKSFSDPILIHYLNFMFDLELGFSFGTLEDSPKINFIDKLLKKVGCFLI